MAIHVHVKIHAASDRQLADRKTAHRILQEVSDKAKGADVGPTLIGATSSLQDPAVWRKVAGRYSQGFERETQIYPYFADRK